MTFTDSIKNYKDYLKCIKNWDSYSVKEQQALKKWYLNTIRKTRKLKDSVIAAIMLQTQKQKGNE